MPVLSSHKQRAQAASRWLSTQQGGVPPGAARASVLTNEGVGTSIGRSLTGLLEAREPSGLDLQ
jgi:hypothetical protein